jgi:alkylresorcinol/alkylpyrone synthase
MTDFERLVPAYANAGIETRHSCVPLGWYEREVGWRERNALYLENALDLLERAARQCLGDGGVRAEEVDAVVTVSSTGIATPSLDARLMDRLPFRSDVERLPVFGLGCAGGVIGLARAATLAQAKPGARVLLLVVELCGLTFRRGDASKSNIIATALFGDGAAAVLLGTGSADRGPRITAAAEHTWPDSLDVMGWNVEDDGLGVLFSRDIPNLIRRDFAPALDGFLVRQGLTRVDLDGLACHPGGMKVLSALEEIFGLPEGGMSAAREVLRRYGNMSAPTALFVLERVLADGTRGRILLTALGPGFTAAFAIVET